MKINALFVFTGVGLLSLGIYAAGAAETSVLFDFDNAPVHTSLPITLSAGGITAQFTATGQGFSIQPADTLGFTPVGFAGLCINPNSVFAADLHVAFSKTLTNFSILYAPEEYACDSSARMRVIAYQGGVSNATSTMTAAAGTWPTATLAISVPAGFDSVVVHYDAPPPTGGDYGPIFMADNMAVTAMSLVPSPIRLTDPMMLPDGTFQFSFTNTPGTSFTVLGTEDPSQSVTNWPVLGIATELAPGQFQFIDALAPNSSAKFYSVRSP